MAVGQSDCLTMGQVRNRLAIYEARWRAFPAVQTEQIEVLLRGKETRKVTLGSDAGGAHAGVVAVAVTVHSWASERRCGSIQSPSA